MKTMGKLITIALCVLIVVLVTLGLLSLLFLTPSESKNTHKNAKKICSAPVLVSVGEEEASDFPIDLVYTWVDGNDASWREAVAKTRKKMSADKIEDAHNAERDPNPIEHDEMYYSICLALKCMPFLRRIFIVTQRPHRPKWLALPVFQTADIVVVHHDEFFQPGVTRPTFNSNVIIAQIPFIKDLSEHYLLSDDDMFPLMRTTRAHFFSKDGVPVIDLDTATEWVYDMKNTSAWWLSLRHTAKMAAELGSATFAVPPHQIMPLLKSGGQELYHRVKDEMRAMRPLRSQFDFVPQYLLLLIIRTIPHLLANNVSGKFYHTGNQFVTDEESGALRNVTFACINNGFNLASEKTLQKVIAAL